MGLWNLLTGKARDTAVEPDDVMPAGGYRLVDADIRLAAVGDIHGRADLLRIMFARLDALAADGGPPLTEIYLGDYVDRGPDSAAVIEMLVRRREACGRIVTLMGNHEELLLKALTDDAEFESWLGIGGRATVASYAPAALASAGTVTELREAFAAAFPQTHARFLAELAHSFRYKGLFFAHAGVRPGVALEAQTQRDLHWIREPFQSHEGDFGAIVVHGHTPHRTARFRRNRVCVDTGAFHTGRLTGIVFAAAGATMIEATV